MRFNCLLKQTSVQTIILTLYVSTLYGSLDKVCGPGKTKLEKNKRLKTNMRLTDVYFAKWPNISNNSTDLLSKMNAESKQKIRNFAGFGVSKPKPWRKDDSSSKSLNANNELIAMAYKKEPAPKVVARSYSAALKMISQTDCGVSELNNMRIVNGKDAQEGAYPWVVAILKGGDGWCGGSIINEKWILSAAHCFMGDQNPRMYAIRVGTIDRNAGTTYKIDKIVMHERFHLDNMFNSDIALMRVNKPIKMGKNVKTVCLPTKQYEVVKSNTLLVVGWGQTSFENKELPTILQEVVLNRIQITDCANRYKKKGNKIYFSQMCTWNKGQDACQGDSGSPAIEWRQKVAYQVGIVSYGSTCADELPGVYTKTSFFLDWLLKQLSSETTDKKGESEESSEQIN